MMSYTCGEIQDRYSNAIRHTEGANWNGNASKAFLTFLINMWKHRCEVLHKIKEGMHELIVWQWHCTYNQNLVSYCLLVTSTCVRNH